MFGFGKFVTLGLSTDLLVWLNPNKLNRRLPVQSYFPLQSKLVFSDMVSKSNFGRLYVGRLYVVDNTWLAIRGRLYVGRLYVVGYTW